MGANLVTRKNAAGKITCYQVRWDQYIDGKRVRRGPTFDPTAAGKAAAKRFLADVLANGKPSRAEAPEAVDALTVERLVERYIEDRAKRVRSDRTSADYARDARLHIYPALGDMAVDDVETHHVQAWVDGIDRAPKTILNLHNLLSSAFKWGTWQRENGHPLVAGNPCTGTELPRRRKVAKGLRPGEFQILFQAAVDTSPEAADLILFLVGTGWRWGEATALQVHEFDPQRRTVEVGRVWRRNAANEMHLVEDAKSDAGYLRKVKVSPRVCAMLERRTTGKQLGDLIFTSSTGHAVRHANFYRDQWRPIVELAQKRGLRSRITPHGLRHSHAALMIESGESLPALQRRLGHESVLTTVGTYGGLVDDVTDAGLDALDAALFGRGPKLRAVSD